jgi:hypothetical protein
MANDYGFDVADTVRHIKGGAMSGIVTELDSEHDLGGVTTCRVVWGAESVEDAMATPREDQDIQWTNKLVLDQ